MTPAMMEYLSQQQVKAMNAENLAKAVALLCATGLGNHAATQDLSDTLVVLLDELNEGLDSINLLKVGRAA